MSDAHSESLEEEANLQTLPRDPPSSTDKSTNDRADDILWVDWDSEGDLENPKKYLLPINFMLFLSPPVPQLAVCQEMGRNCRCFFIHIHFPNFVHNGGPGDDADRT